MKPKQIQQKHQIVTDMKSSLIIFLILIMNCSTSKVNNQNSNTFYFYFEKTDGKMNSYYNAEKHKKSYWYELDKAAKILFLVKKNNEGFIIKTIKGKDTVGFGVKTYDWLNKFDNFKRDSFFYRKPAKNFCIIEKDSSNNKLNLIEVEFIDEIE